VPVLRPVEESDVDIDWPTIAVASKGSFSRTRRSDTTGDGDSKAEATAWCRAEISGIDGFS